MRLVLDKEKCTSCGACLKACPLEPRSLSVFDCRQCAPEHCGNECVFNALVEGKKCDLCSGNPKCVSACPENALSLCKDLLGWRVEPFGEYIVPYSLDLTEGREQLLDLLLEKYLEKASGDVSEEKSRADLTCLLKDFCEQENVLLDKKVGEALVEVAVRNVVGFGVFDYLLADDSLEEISVVGVNKPIYVFVRGNGWRKTNCVLCSESFAIDVINKMARALGRRITYQKPRLNAMLPDGSRLHATIAPLSLNGVEFTVRKFKKNPLTVLDLLENNTISAEAAAFLWLAVHADTNILIAGNTGSGKTTLLNALFSFVPSSERVIVAEETPELSFAQKHCVKIVANEELSISMSDLVKDTLRMRPDRVVIGEVRSREEVSALFDSLLAGQARGCYATLHAQSTQEALARLVSLGVNPQDLNAVDLFVIIKRMLEFDSLKKTEREVRRVTEISTVSKQGAALIFSPTGFNSSAFTSSRLFEKIFSTYGFNGEKDFLKELSERKKFLEKLVGKKLSLKEFNALVETHLFSE